MRQKLVNGWLTLKIQNFVGFKGLAFIVGTAAMLAGKIDSHDWTNIALSVAGLKVLEDIGRAYLKE